MNIFTFIFTFIFTLAIASYSVADYMVSPKDCENPGALSAETPKDYKEVNVGKIADAQVWQVYRNLKDTKGKDQPNKPDCTNLEIRFKKGTTCLNLLTYDSKDYEIQSIIINEKKIIVKKLSLFRMDEEGEHRVEVYKYNDRKVKLLSAKTVKPHSEKQDQIFHQLKKARTAGELRVVNKRILDLNKDPTGWHNLKGDLFRRYTPVFLKKLKPMHTTNSSSGLSGLAVEFAQAILSDSAKEKNPLVSADDGLLMFSKYDIDEPEAGDLELWRQLAYYMKIQGQKKEANHIEEFRSRYLR